MNEFEKAQIFFSLTSKPNTIKINYSKKKNQIEYAAFFDPETDCIYVYESSSNPHLVNSEIKCTWDELLNQSTEDSLRMKSIIISNFNEKTYYHLIVSVKHWKLSQTT
jgi:hypothetical protein